MLSEECMTRQRGEEKCKTKTKSILKTLDSPSYKRQALPLLTRLTSIEARALIMGRYGMLDCRANFSKGYGGKLCKACYVIDDEMHRVNFCQKYDSINRYDNPEKVDFGTIYSDNVHGVKPVLNAILKMWDLENGRNKMKL